MAPTDFNDVEVHSIAPASLTSQAAGRCERIAPGINRVNPMSLQSVHTIGRMASFEANSRLLYTGYRLIDNGLMYFIYQCVVYGDEIEVK